MKKNVKSLDDLEKGIKQLLFEDRCSFSDEEKVLLNDCILVLQKAGKQTQKMGIPDLGSIAKGVELLLKLFIAGEHLKDIF